LKSIKNRFFFSVFTNLIRAVISFATGIALARILEPNHFGRLSFLLGTFLSFSKILDLGTSQAFYTFLSQKRQSRKFIQLYFIWLFIEICVTLVVLGLLFPDDWITFFWKGENKLAIILAFLASFLQNTVWLTFQRIFESERKTYFSQILNVSISISHLLAIIFFWYFNLININIILLLIILEYVLLIFFLQKKIFNSNENNSEFILDVVLKQYLKFISPLIIYNLLAFLYEFSDKWFLQTYGGSTQQAFYSVSNQFSSIALLATSSIINIIWKEMSEAYFLKDIGKLYKLYIKSTNVLLFIGALIAGFLIPWTEKIVYFFLGYKYIGGYMTMAIMFLYPIHQSIGQINGTLLYATEKIKLQVLLGIIFMIASVIASYFFLAPKTNFIPGLGLASKGLAIKMVLLQFIQVTATGLLISKQFKWEFKWITQIMIILICLTSGFFCNYFILKILPDLNFFVSIFINSLIYLLVNFTLFWNMPFLIGFSKKERHEYADILFSRVKSFF
jgi:O-antigen/teichoic acid export membrane protein